jgi:predicted nucleotidyltransferase
MNELLTKCNWPKLPEKYDIALRTAVEFILENYTVLGIIVSGTIIRGNPDPSSDLDIYVIHDQPFRQRLQKFFNEIPAEIFVNPPKSVERYFEEEQAARRPLTAHMLSTGFVVLNLDPVIGDLLSKAERLLSQPPEAPQDLTYQRYLSALLFEDAEDIVARDPETAAMIVYRAVAEMLNFCFIKAGSFLPRQKSMLVELAKIDTHVAELARGFYQASTLSEKMELAGRIADRTIEKRGFFEWEMPPNEVSK